MCTYKENDREEDEEDPYDEAGEGSVPHPVHVQIGPTCDIRVTTTH